MAWHEVHQTQPDSVLMVWLGMLLAVGLGVTAALLISLWLDRNG